MVLSGMSDVAQMQDNLATMADFRPLNEEEQQVITRAQAALESLPQIPCTRCDYCKKGCPQEINIPGVFKAMNQVLVYNNLPGAKGNYNFETRNGKKAADCIACGQCESVCPQHIKIIDELKRAAETFR